MTESCFIRFSRILKHLETSKYTNIHISSMRTIYRVASHFEDCLGTFHVALLFSSPFWSPWLVERNSNLSKYVCLRWILSQHTLAFMFFRNRAFWIQKHISWSNLSLNGHKEIIRLSKLLWKLYIEDYTGFFVNLLDTR